MVWAAPTKWFLDQKVASWEEGCTDDSEMGTHTVPPGAESPAFTVPEAEPGSPGAEGRGRPGSAGRGWGPGAAGQRSSPESTWAGPGAHSFVCFGLFLIERKGVPWNKEGPWPGRVHSACEQ